MEATQIAQPYNISNIALLPPPTFLGHLIPFIELAKKLVSKENCIVTIIILDDGSQMKAQRSLLEKLPPSISHVFLPQVATDDLPEDLHPEILLPAQTMRSLPAIRDALVSMRESSSSRLAALVVDLFAPSAIQVAKELGIQAYVFYVVAANELWLAMNLPELDKSCTCEYTELSEPLKLPGSIPLLPEDVPDDMRERNSDLYKNFLSLSHQYRLADGILSNSFLGLEQAALMEMAGCRQGVPPVYPVGPLVRTGMESEPRESECLKWLDNQPPKSVLYVAFGSGGTLSKEQLHELAFGLEMSGQRFLWAVRGPQENTTAAYLNGPRVINGEDLMGFLPESFMDRTKGKGMVVPTWAPQIEILSHGSIGGFMTHGGWNSILESILFGVPLILRPLCFEQKMNAAVMSDGLKLAIRVRENKRGIVDKENIAELVRELMAGESGKQLQKRMSEIKTTAAKALSPDGSSTKALDQVVRKWRNAW